MRVLRTGPSSQALGAAAVAAHLRRRRARGADRAVGGVGSRLRQAPEGDHPDADRGDGAPWASGAGGRGARGAVEDERGHDRSSAATAARALQHSAPATGCDIDDPPIDPGSDLLGLARSASGFVEADLVAHSGPVTSGSFVQTLVVTDIASGLDGACAAAGARADVAGRRARRDPPAVAVSACSASTPTTIPSS